MDNTNVFMNEPLSMQEKAELRNDPMNRLIDNFSRGNFDVKAEEIFNKKADAEDKQDITILPVDEHIAPMMVLVTEQQAKDLNNLITNSQEPCMFGDRGKITCLHCQAEMTSSVIEGDPPDSFLLSSH